MDLPGYWAVPGQGGPCLPIHDEAPAARLDIVPDRGLSREASLYTRTKISCYRPLKVISRANALPEDTSPRLPLCFDADQLYTPGGEADLVGIRDLATAMIQANFQDLTVS